MNARQQLRPGVRFWSNAKRGPSSLFAGNATRVFKRVGATDYFVAMNGNDANPGTENAPFQTIQEAVDGMKSGGTCVVGPGTYRESAQVRRTGKDGKPIRFMAQPGAQVLLLGTEPVASEWAPYKDGIYKTQVAIEFPQLFVDGKMMVEAR